MVSENLKNIFFGTPFILVKPSLDKMKGTCLATDTKYLIEARQNLENVSYLEISYIVISCLLISNGHCRK